MATTAETIRELTRNHLERSNGLLLGQCVRAVGWIGGTVPDCRNIVELPTTDIAGAAFAVGCALAGRRPIFVVRYQGFMWLNASPLVNYAAKSKEVWGTSCPVFIRALGMEGSGVGHTASNCFHALFMHSPGIPVAAPMTPGEYRQVWNTFMQKDLPLYVSEHRRSFSLSDEMADIIDSASRITIIAISAARLNAIEAHQILRQQGIHADLFHVVWLKPFSPTEHVLASLKKTGFGIVIDSGFEIAGAARSLAYELMHQSGARVYALGLPDAVCGASPRRENITPSAGTIVSYVSTVLEGPK